MSKVHNGKWEGGGGEGSVCIFGYISGDVVVMCHAAAVGSGGRPGAAAAAGGSCGGGVNILVSWCTKLSQRYQLCPLNC